MNAAEKLAKNITANYDNQLPVSYTHLNECTLQPLIHDLPFGGVGNSGMGKYHGEWGFRAYSNARGVLYHSTKLDVAGLRYPPYNQHQHLRELVIPS